MTRSLVLVATVVALVVAALTRLLVVVQGWEGMWLQ